jgi:hypothetical protein
VDREEARLVGVGQLLVLTGAGVPTAAIYGVS